LLIGISNFRRNNELHGFCWNQKRYLSDDEKIHAAITAINEQKSITITSETNDTVQFKNFEYMPYKNVDDFLRENPSCCRVLYSPYKDSVAPRKFMDRIWGLGGGSVEVTFNASYKDGEEVKSLSLVKYVKMTNCAKTF
jgi:hypothetical protein